MKLKQKILIEIKNILHLDLTEDAKFETMNTSVLKWNNFFPVSKEIFDKIIQSMNDQNKKKSMIVKILFHSQGTVCHGFCLLKNGSDAGVEKKS